MTQSPTRCFLALSSLGTQAFCGPMAMRLHASADLAWEPTPAWGIQALTGRIHAPRGRFDSPLTEVAPLLRSRPPVLSPRP